MPLSLRDRSAATHSYDSSADSVRFLRRLLQPRHLARAIGLGRLAVGGGFLLAPVTSVRILGMDTATAKRVTYLARMAAVRDVSIGVGTLASTRPSGWLLAGALSDAVDAAVVADAIRSGRAGGPTARLVVAGAAAVAVVGTIGAVGAVASLRSLRRPA